jgi:anti-sigma B factor antagonist
MDFNLKNNLKNEIKPIKMYKLICQFKLASQVYFQIDKFETYTILKVLLKSLEKDIAQMLKSEFVLLVGKGDKNIILDLSNCSYIDSAAFSAILVGNRLCKNAFGTFVMTGLNDQVERLIKISGMNTLLNITGSVKEAEALIKGSNKII